LDLFEIGIASKNRQNHFPDSVRIKAAEKHFRYQTLQQKTRETFKLNKAAKTHIREKLSFKIICAYGYIDKYENTYENTLINLTICSTPIHFFAFEKLPGNIHN